METVNSVDQLAANENDQVAVKESPPVRLRLERISNQEGTTRWYP
jgi:hypothetical protein